MKRTDSSVTGAGGGLSAPAVAGNTPPSPGAGGAASRPAGSGLSLRERAAARSRARKRSIMPQILLGTAGLAVTALVAVVAQAANPNGAAIIILGAGLGYTLQRSRFCFTASFRDPFVSGATDLAKAVIIAIALSTLLLLGLNFARFGLETAAITDASAYGNIKPYGVHTAVGAFLFSLGAVIAGGCASGSLMRMGEGFVQQWLVLPFFIIGSTAGLALLKIVRRSPLLFSGRSDHLPALLGGWVPAIILQGSALLALYIVVDRIGRRKR